MPRQLRSVEEFKRLAEHASECRVVRRNGRVKLKLRTSRMLYTYITGEEEAGALLKELKIKTVEL